jgi:hypothetical protein
VQPPVPSSSAQSITAANVMSDSNTTNSALEYTQHCNSAPNVGQHGSCNGKNQEYGSSSSSSSSLTLISAGRFAKYFTS